MIQWIASAQSDFSFTEIAQLKGHTDPVMSVTFSPDGTLLASGGDDASLRLWQISDYTQIEALYPHASFIKGVAFNPDGTLLASGSWDRTIGLYDVEDTSLTPQPQLTGFEGVVEQIEFSPNGERLAFGVGDGTVHITEVSTKAEIDLLVLNGGLQVTSLDFSPDGMLLATAAGFPADDAQVWILDENDRPAATLTGHTGTITSLEFLENQEPEGNYVMGTAGDDGTVRLWQIQHDMVTNTLEANEISVLTPEAEVWFTSIDFSGDGTLLAAGTLEGKIYVWDISSLDAPSLIAEINDHNGAVHTLAFHPTQTLLAAGGDDGIIRLWGTKD